MSASVDRRAAERLRQLADAIEGALADDEGVEPWLAELRAIADELDPRAA